MASGNELYLGNLEEAVIDEHKVVTYKWLCHNINVTANVAKQMLFEFVNRRKQTTDDLNVTYVVGGVRGKLNDNQVHSVCVVPSSQLDAVKKEFKFLTSVHIYSIQKVAIRDQDVLYGMDCDSSKEIDIKRASAINCYAVAHISKISTTSDTEDKQESDVVQPSLNTLKVATKKKMEPKGSLISMFANAGKTNVPLQKSTNRERKLLLSDVSVETSRENSTCLTKALKSNDYSKKEDKKENPSSMEKETKPPKKKNKEKERKDSCKMNAPKMQRKRIMRMSDSSDDDVDIHEQEKSRTRVLDEPENKEQDEDPISLLTVQNTGKGHNGKRKRKLLEESFLDDDGYLSTKKRWTECSDGESGSDENVIVASPTDVKRIIEEKQSPAKNKVAKLSSAKNKQATLTSFFKRK